MAAYREFTGLRNTVPAERLGAGDLVAANNVDIDASGRISRRDGLTLATAGAYHSLFASGNTCLIVSGANLLRISQNYALTVLRSGLTLNATMAYVAVNERIYYSNGHQTGCVENSGSRTWGIVPPSSQGQASEVSGNLPAGAYQWAITFLRDDEQESGTGLAGRIDLQYDGAGIAFSNLPVSDDPGVTGKVLYLSSANGSTLYESHAISNTETSASIVSPIVGGYPLTTQFLSPPPAGQCLAHFNGRIYVASGRYLYPSEPMADELFNREYAIEFDDEITLLAPVDGGLVISAGAMTGFLAGSSPEDFALTTRNTQRAIPGTLVQVNGALLLDGASGTKDVPMWMSDAGICIATPDGQISNLTENRYRMSENGQGAALFLPDFARYVAVLNR